MWSFNSTKLSLPTPEQALPGRGEAIPVAARHAASGGPMIVDDGALEVALFGMGCFWGAERMMWSVPGVVTTAAGYAGGSTPNPTYREVCSGMTGHTEVVRVVWDPTATSLDALLRVFWEGHDPTQGMRQGNDVGTQYRSALYVTSEAQRAVATASRDAYQRSLTAAGFGAITTEIRVAQPFYFAEDPHQQYLFKNPGGYCGHGGTGVACPVGLGVGGGGR